MGRWLASLSVPKEKIEEFFALDYVSPFRFSLLCQLVNISYSGSRQTAVFQILQGLTKQGRAAARWAPVEVAGDFCARWTDQETSGPLL